MRRLGAAAAMAVVGLASARASAQVPPAAPDKLALGDWLFAPTAELRVRGEYRHDPVDIGGTALGGVVYDTYGGMERTRLGLGAEHGAIRAQITLQDAHAWGAMPPTATVPSSSSLGIFGVYEAFFELHTKDARPSFLRVGRQAVTWGEGRLISSADWSPTGRSLDAIRGRYSKGEWDFEVLGAVLEAQVPLGASFGSTTGPQKGGSELTGVQVVWTLDPLFKIEASGIGRFTQPASSAPSLVPVVGVPPRFEQALFSGQTYVASLRVAGNGHGWSYGLEGAYELGRATGMGCLATSGTGAGTAGTGCTTEARSAFAGAAHVSYKFDTLLLTPTLRLGGAYASGDDNGNTYKQFDPLLPDVHTWHGAMDVLAWSNEIEGNAKVTVVPWTDATISAEYRFAALATATGDWLNAYLGEIGGGTPASGGAPKTLGHEIDGEITWRPWPVFGVAAGYSAFLLGDGARTILSGPLVGRGGPGPIAGSVDAFKVSHFAFLQATLTIP